MTGAIAIPATAPTERPLLGVPVGAFVEEILVVWGIGMTLKPRCAVGSGRVFMAAVTVGEGTCPTESIVGEATNAVDATLNLNQRSNEEVHTRLRLQFLT